MIVLESVPTEGFCPVPLASRLSSLGRAMGQVGHSRAAPTPDQYSISLPLLLASPNDNRCEDTDDSMKGSVGVNHPLRSLNMNLDSLASSGQQGAAARAQELLQRIEALHDEGYYQIAPNIVSYNSVLKAWANEQGGADHAMDLFVDMTEKDGQRVVPDTVTFNTLIWAYAREGRGESDLDNQKQTEHPSWCFVLHASPSFRRDFQ